MTARRIIIHGRVQGVFYRDWAIDTARSLGLAGWVRNLPDGTVEAHLEGETEAIARMVAAMHDGSAHAQVKRVEERMAQAEGLGGFERR